MLGNLLQLSYSPGYKVRTFKTLCVCVWLVWPSSDKFGQPQNLPHTMVSLYPFPVS